MNEIALILHKMCSFTKSFNNGGRGNSGNAEKKLILREVFPYIRYADTQAPMRHQLILPFHPVCNLADCYRSSALQTRPKPVELGWKMKMFDRPITDKIELIFNNLIDQNSSTLHAITSNCKKVAEMQCRDNMSSKFRGIQNFNTHQWFWGRQTMEYGQPGNHPQFESPPSLFLFFHPFAVNNCFFFLKIHWLIL